MGGTVRSGEWNCDQREVKDVLGREKDMCKGLGVGAFWVCSRSRKKEGGKWGKGEEMWGGDGPGEDIGVSI